MKTLTNIQREVLNGFIRRINCRISPQLGNGLTFYTKDSHVFMMGLGVYLCSQMVHSEMRGDIKKADEIQDLINLFAESKTLTSNENICFLGIKPY